MKGNHHKEHFWRIVIWPILWPWLLAQLALVVLCLLVAGLIWGATPPQTSWIAVMGMMAALMLGSSLNVGAFIVMLRARVRRSEQTFEQTVGELEQHVAALGAKCERMGMAAVVNNRSWNQADLVARLKSVNYQLIVMRQAGYKAVPSTEQTQVNSPQTLLDDLAHTQQQLDHLQQGRDRAREESRLKSGYLNLLQRETHLLFQQVDQWSPSGSTGVTSQDLTELKERLADVRALLANLVEEAPVQAGGSVPVSARRAKVLVVDDGPVNLMLAKQVMEKQGLEVTAVDSGQKALACQQQQHFDLVFMDIFMPDMDGLETSRRWRAFEKTQHHESSILVALTANADSAGRKRCLQAGMNDLLAKPYQPESLINRVAAWFPDEKFPDKRFSDERFPDKHLPDEHNETLMP
ncbi:response regulator [Halomonas sp. LS-001]